MRSFARVIQKPNFCHALCHLRRKRSSKEEEPYSPSLSKDMALLTNELFFFLLLMKRISTIFTIDISSIKTDNSSVKKLSFLCV